MKFKQYQEEFKSFKEEVKLHASKIKICNCKLGCDELIFHDSFCLKHYPNIKSVINATVLYIINKYQEENEYSLYLLDEIKDFYVELNYILESVKILKGFTFNPHISPFEAAAQKCLSLYERQERTERPFLK